MMHIEQTQEEQADLLTQIFLELSVRVPSDWTANIKTLSFNRINGDVVQSILVKKLPHKKPFLTFRLILGVRHELIISVLNELGGAKNPAKFTSLIWIGRIIKGRLRDISKRYHCFPPGEWQIRNSSEIEKTVNGIVIMIQNFADDYFETSSELKYISDFPNHIADENPINFYKYKLISAGLLDDKFRYDEIKSFYKKKPTFDESWVKQCDKYFCFLS